jgi:hypothetical protein
LSGGEDPVKLGLVASLARPGGNLTGINWLGGELAAKRLELLRQLLPAATHVAVMVNPAFATLTEITLRDVEAGARAMGLQIQVLNADTSREIDAAFELLGASNPTPSSSRRDCTPCNHGAFCRLGTERFRCRYESALQATSATAAGLLQLDWLLYRRASGRRMG